MGCMYYKMHECVTTYSSRAKPEGCMWLQQERIIQTAQVEVHVLTDL